MIEEYLDSKSQESTDIETNGEGFFKRNFKKMKEGSLRL